MRSGLAVVIVTAAVLRLGLLVAWSGNLSDDIDAYLGIGQNIAEGRGFSTPGTREPTAYRPPLYPLLLAPLLWFGGGPAAIGGLHLLLGTATVWLTYRLGRQLHLGWTALLAAALVAVDPLLLQYMTFPMTETLFAFLVGLLLVLVVSPSAQHLAASGGRQPPGQAVQSRESRVKSQEPATTDNGQRTTDNGPQTRGLTPPARLAAIGIVFGLAALCRPTVWLLGLLAGLWWLAMTVRRQGVRRLVSHLPWPMLVALALVVSPWLVRNILVLGRPVLTTTHGGYTLLLGNNPVFYREVVDRPWGTVWDDAPPHRTQQAWYARLQAEMDRDLGPHADEVESDRWMYQRAYWHIADEPGTFVRACWLRFRRLWNIVPMRPAGEAFPAVIRWGVGLFYGAVLVAMLAGLVRLTRSEWPRWMPLVLLIAAVTLTHLVYWSNTRMRAPLVPVIALLAARGVSDLRRDR